MYRAMIVDDEEPALDSFSHVLKKGVPGFELCGVARSGSEAISLVPELRPDLVFMDIQMPGMDGIEAITAIQKRFPDIIFILETAYERFDIAQKAIPLGVFNYLVKPVSRKVLIDEFAKAKTQLDEMHEKEERRLEEADYARRMRDEETRRFLLGLAWASPDERGWREFARLFSIQSDSGSIALVEIINPLPENEIEDLYRAMLQRFQYKCNCLSAVLAGRMILLVSEMSASEKVERLLEMAAEGVGNYEIRLGIGGVRHYSRLSESYRVAFEQLRSYGGQEVSPIQRRREIQDLCEKFLYSEWAEVRASYERHWTGIFMSNSFLAAKVKIIVFFVQLMTRLDEEPRIRCDIDIDPAEEIIGLSSIQAWEQWSAYMMDRLRFIIKENKDHYYPKPLSLAVTYLKENYAKPLQLFSVAEHCEISQGYLSRLFSEYLNTTFIDYLNTLRISEAVKLLRDEKNTIKEIAYLVGYSDPNYFSRIFRRYMNVSPTELVKGGAINEV
jgi:two-component system response regulator YesN